MHLRIPIIVSLCLLLRMQVALLLPPSTETLTIAESAVDLHPPHLTAVQQSSLRPRVPPFAIMTWQIEYFVYQIQVVVAVSVGSVLAYYGLTAMDRIMSDIIEDCLTTWAGIPSRNQVVVEAGNMRLEFGCATEPVMVEFIHDWAHSRRDAIRRGFAPVYAKEWWFDGRNRTRRCYVGIRMVPDGGTAEKPDPESSQREK